MSRRCELVSRQGADPVANHPVVSVRRGDLDVAGEATARLEVWDRATRFSEASGAELAEGQLRLVP